MSVLGRKRHRLHKARQPAAVDTKLAAVAAAEAREELAATIAMRGLNDIYQLIRLIDQAERGEQEPERLDLLYRLDHLAARLRRSSEGLLLLAGQPVPFSREETMPLADIARAALGESHDFTRVRVGRMPAAALIPGAAADAVHLLAQLIDNALAMSSEKALVTISGDAVSEGIALRVEDQGIGIPLSRISLLNARLAKAPVLDADATRQMGLYVVANLAHRLGALVQLQPRSGGGTSAVVVIPDHLVTVLSAASSPSLPKIRTTPPIAHSARAGGVGSDRWAHPPAPAQTAGITAHGLPQRRRPQPAPWRPEPAARTARSRPPDPQAVLKDLNDFDAGTELAKRDLGERR